MSVRTLHTFQEDAVKSGVAVFARAKELLDASWGDADSRTRAVAHNGYLLIEAPTGSGKTLIAGHILEKFSTMEDVVWFWFAPFSGVTGQTEATLRDQFKGLKLQKLSEDRSAAAAARGDVYVTTWQTVATRVKDRRNVRRTGELNPSVDDFVAALRARNLRIGVVVDEAHHSFHGDTQAARFFHDVLSPEYTILVTATPDDADIKDFEKKLGIAELQRIGIARVDVVRTGLIKDGVKCAAYLPDADKEKLVDLEGVALKDAVRAHRRIKKLLAECGVPLIPLLLVQVDSGDDEAAAKTEKSVQRMQDRLLALGFTAGQIAVHTAREPDPSLLALANDERREVLVFKMAVALGFDAPRAFTLMSSRATRDPDFGVQLVGRILRVHRLLQARERDGKVPAELRYGYVFLAHASTQEGLDIAGQRINAVKTEYAKASATTLLVRVGESATVQWAPDGQLQLMPDPLPVVSEARSGEPAAGGAGTAAETELDLGRFFSPAAAAPLKPGATSASVAGPGAFRYPLRPNVPRRFKTECSIWNNEVTEEDCARRFVVSTRDLFDALKGRIGVQRKTLEIFTHQLELNFVGAELDPDRAAQQAQKILQRGGVLDPRELKRALLDRMQAVMREEMMDGADDRAQVARFLDVILATHPNLLVEAQKAAVAETAKLTEAGDLPAEIVSEQGLPVSRGNVYGVVPPDLNDWERQFAGMLDNDPAGVVGWWHRNLPHKSWSVNVLLPDGRGFYPDFVIGVEGRKTEDGVLLADPKRAFGDPNEAPKSTARHRAYGRVLILYRDNTARWMVVRYDEKKRVPVLDCEFRFSDAAGF
jgi:hypothetical protein